MRGKAFLYENPCFNFSALPVPWDIPPGLSGSLSSWIADTLHKTVVRTESLSSRSQWRWATPLPLRVGMLPDPCKENPFPVYRRRKKKSSLLHGIFRHTFKPDGWLGVRYLVHCACTTPDSSRPWWSFGVIQHHGSWRLSQIMENHCLHLPHLVIR